MQCDSPVHEGGDVLLAGDVAGNESGGKLLGQRLARIVPDVAEHEHGALAREPARGRFAKPARRAGYHSDLAFKPHRCPLLSIWSGRCAIGGSHTGQGVRGKFPPISSGR